MSASFFLFLAAGRTTCRNGISQKVRHLSITQRCCAQPANATPISEPHPSETLESSTSTEPPSTPNLDLKTLHEQEDKEFLLTSPTVTGRVARAGTMKQTVAVETNRQYFDKYLQKHYTRAFKALVHDPADTLAEGDVIKYGVFPPHLWEERVKRGKKNVKFVLREVITPFGLPVDQRAPRVVTPRPKATTTRFDSQRQRGSRR